MDLTDEQWEVIKPLLPKLPRRADGKGKPWRESRDVFNGILWILRTGGPRQDLPDRYPLYQTCHRRFQSWIQNGTMGSILKAIAKDLKGRGGLDLKECFIDGTFVPAKKGVQGLKILSGAKVRRSWQLQTALVFLSPYALKVLTVMKDGWWRTRSNVGL
jgi:transposase